MSIARVICEFLLRAVFALARVAFLAQGLAMLAATLATSMVVAPDWPAWAGHALRSSQLASATLLVAGVALLTARRWNPPELTDPGDRTVRLLLALSLVLLPLLAWIRSADLLVLWPEIFASLDQIGFWKGFERPDPFGGIVLLPILVALFVPAIETAAAFCLVALPPMLLALLVLRSRLFPRAFVMLVICQAALVICGYLAADAFSVLATALDAAMATERDLDVHSAAELLMRVRDTLSSTAGALSLPAFGFFAWLVFLVLSRWAGVQVGETAARGNRA